MNTKETIYKLVHGDMYRRQKLNQGEGNDLLPEWDPADDGQLQTEDELIEFLNGRIDGLLLVWSNLTGWNMSHVAEAVTSHQGRRWRAEGYEWIDLSVVDTVGDEMQCPWCGSIYAAKALLWPLPRGAMDDEDRMPICDDCAPRYVPRDAIAEAEARRADESGGQKPIDGPFQESQR